jgi:hypothetical protein
LRCVGHKVELTTDNLFTWRKKSVIIVELLGGLGNQLFQYCLGRRLSLENDVPLFVDTSLLEDTAPGRHLVSRKFALDIFDVPIQRAPLRHRLRYSAAGLPRSVRGALRFLRITQPSRRLVEKKFGYDAEILKCGKSAYISGLWQSEQYFQPTQSVIRQDLRFRFGLPETVSHLSSTIQKSNSVCVHVRRTDYLSTPGNNSPMAFVGLEFYRNAVKQACRQIEDPKFFVFSDDPEWCRNELRFIPNVTFVGAEHAGYKDNVHLQLMTLCRHFIIPNSTFSWWAAWLSKSIDKIVYMPNVWFKDVSLDASGLRPRGWIVII